MVVMPITTQEMFTMSFTERPKGTLTPLSRCVGFVIQGYTILGMWNSSKKPSSICFNISRNYRMKNKLKENFKSFIPPWIEKSIRAKFDEPSSEETCKKLSALAVGKITFEPSKDGDILLWLLRTTGLSVNGVPEQIIILPYATPSLNETLQILRLRGRGRPLPKSWIWKQKFLKSLKSWFTGKPYDPAKGKRKVRVYRFSRRTLDHDNFVGGCKSLMDSLKIMDLIVDDTPEFLEAEYIQVKSPCKQTVIIIEGVNEGISEGVK
jgi:hypothetical protein